MKVALLLAVVGMCSASGWHYGEDWTAHYPICGGSSQSPINLAASLATCGGSTPSLNLGLANGHATNNGHAIEVEVPAGQTVEIDGKKFDVLQFHFHWGKTDNVGSEHTVDGQHKPVEMHVVCGRNNGAELAVLGFFYELGATNGNLQPLINVMGSLSQGSKVAVNIQLGALTSPATSGKFYRYSGSLTTPPCSEIVTWTVYQTPLKISAAQLAAFRGTSIGGNNFRPVQALNGRSLKNSAC